MSEVGVVERKPMSRNQAIMTAVLAVTWAAVALAVYYSLPLIRKPHAPVWSRLLVALAIFGVVLVLELRSIARHADPMRRAVIALSVLLPLFVLTFAWIYLTISRSNPAAFGESLSRSSALYFTITVLSTVGFGDIVPKTDPARLVTAVQMISDLTLLAVIVRLIFDVASRAAASRRLPPNDN